MSQMTFVSTFRLFFSQRALGISRKQRNRVARRNFTPKTCESAAATCYATLRQCRANLRN